MKLKFLGTKGYIEPESERHARHASMLVSYYGKDVMVDCGEDWVDEVYDINPHVIFLTHAHPDHAWGLKNGAPCPVFATADSWETLNKKDYPVKEKKVVGPREVIKIYDLTFEAFPVDHSTIAPAVGYRIQAGEVIIFYVPDVVYIPDRKEALKNARIYIGDGATITRSMVRKPEEELIGHTPLRTQLTWCQKENVPKAIFTHCGSAIVKSDPDEVQEKVEKLAKERNVKVQIAYDGMEIILRS